MTQLLQFPWWKTTKWEKKKIRIIKRWHSIRFVSKALFLQSAHPSLKIAHISLSFSLVWNENNLTTTNNRKIGEKKRNPWALVQVFVPQFDEDSLVVQTTGWWVITDDILNSFDLIWCDYALEFLLRKKPWTQKVAL